MADKRYLLHCICILLHLKGFCESSKNMYLQRNRYLKDVGMEVVGTKKKGNGCSANQWVFDKTTNFCWIFMIKVVNKYIIYLNIGNVIKIIVNS